MIKLIQIFICCLAFQVSNAGDACPIPGSYIEESLCTRITDYTGGMIGQMLHPKDPKDYNPELEMARQWKLMSKMSESIPCFGGMIHSFTDPLVDPPSDEMRCIAALGAYIVQAFEQIKQMINELANLIVAESLWLEFNREIKQPIDDYRAMISQLLSNDTREAKGILPLFKQKCVDSLMNPRTLANTFRSKLSENCNHLPKTLTKISSIVKELFTCISTSITNEKINGNTSKTQTLEIQIKSMFFNLKNLNEATKLKDKLCLTINEMYFDSYNGGLEYVVNFLKNNNYKVTTCLTYFVYDANKNVYYNRVYFTMIVTNTMSQIQFVSATCLNVSYSDPDVVYAANKGVQIALNETMNFVSSYLFEPEHTAFDQFENYLNDGIDMAMAGIDCSYPYTIANEIYDNARKFFASDLKLYLQVMTRGYRSVASNCVKPTCLFKKNLEITHCYELRHPVLVIFNVYKGNPSYMPSNVTDIINRDRGLRSDMVEKYVNYKIMRNLIAEMQTYLANNHLDDIYKTLTAVRVEDGNDYAYIGEFDHEIYFVSFYDEIREYPRVRAQYFVP